MISRTVPEPLTQFGGIIVSEADWLPLKKPAYAPRYKLFLICRTRNEGALLRHIGWRGWRPPQNRDPFLYQPRKIVD
ncbi:hypothetical protein C6A37_01380 [Desulfobacteraceae bacterium SEEP-SAG9]|nr:hypothetical protein C6A37_01380 [Desulfobacteraceae bacterium SEEP-SAG9]